MDISAFDIGSQAESQVRQVRKPQPIKPFFRGPVPLDWMQRAARLPGKAFQVALAIWHLRTLAKLNSFKMEQKHVRAFGVRRDAYHRALRALEGAQLITATRSHGRNAVISIIQDHQNAKEAP